MEDFSKVFTIEINGPKGWEVVGTYNSLVDAVHRYEEEMLQRDPIVAVRLTSPTDVSIYS